MNCEQLTGGTANTGESPARSGTKKALLWHDKKDAVKSFVTYYATPIKESHEFSSSDAPCYNAP